MPRKRRFDSLFARLLLAQALLVVCAATLFAMLLNAERSILLAEVHADQLAPLLAKAVGAPPVPAPSRAVRKGAEPTEGLWAHVTGLPASRALRQSLAQRGFRVDDVALQIRGTEPTLWLLVQPAQSPAVWIGVDGMSILPGWSLRLTVGLLVVLLMVAASSWAFARKVSRPLAELRSSIEAQAPGRHANARDAPQRPAEGSAEVVAIASAYADLQVRTERYERERRMLLGGVSHDLRSPLARIRLAAEMLPENGENQDGVQAIVRNVEKADRLVGSFLDFVRAGELALDETVDLAALARYAASAFGHLVALPQVVAPAHLTYGPANALLIERLIANLIDNAFKHGRAPVLVTVTAQAGGACIDVEDQGDGMAPEAALRLQEAFARGDRSRGVPGTGLGLAIVRQVVQRLGGTLTIERLPSAHRVRVMLPPRL